MRTLITYNDNKTYYEVFEFFRFNYKVWTNSIDIVGSPGKITFNKLVYDNED